jgi:hypothetical protein
MTAPRRRLEAGRAARADQQARARLDGLLTQLFADIAALGDCEHAKAFAGPRTCCAFEALELIPRGNGALEEHLGRSLRQCAPVAVLLVDDRYPPPLG